MFYNEFITYLNNNCFRTHMPYVYYKDNEPELIFSRLINNTWRLYFYDKKTNDFVKINTKTEYYVNEYNPTIWVNKNNNLNMTYTYSYNDEKNLMFLENAKTLVSKRNNFITIVSDLIATITESYKIICDYFGHIKIYNKQTEELIKILNIQEEYVPTCICSVPGDENTIIISWNHGEGLQKVAGSLIYNIQTDKAQDLFVLETNESPYKPCLDPYTNRLYYSIKLSAQFKDRQIAISDNWTLKPSKLIKVVEE